MFSSLLKTKKSSRFSRLRIELLEERWVPSTLMVDDDLVQCPTAAYTTISAAVAAAEAGDTIHVCEGTYQESVTVDKTLTLEGDNRLAIVEPPTGLTGFNLQADNISLSGFTIRNASNNAGVYTSPTFSGYRIHDNLFLNNTFGLYLNSSGDFETIVSDNEFDANNNPGAAAGNGIYADQGSINLRIEENYFHDHVNAGILFANAGTPQNDIQIVGNRSVNDASFVALFNADDVRIEGNTVLDTNSADNADQGSKIFIGGDSNGIVVRRNIINGGGYDGIAVRDTLGAAGGTSNVQISGNAISNVDRDGISITATAVGAAQITGNRIHDVGRDGILLDVGTSANLLDKNLIDGSGRDGISLVGSTNNTITSNHSTNNGRDGIRVDASSTGNIIRKNHLRGNAEHDAHDDSVGAGTAGTANIWDDNQGNTQNRPGLLKAKGKKS